MFFPLFHKRVAMQNVGMNLEERIAKNLGVRTAQVAAVVQLLDEGNTVPFIARYRKERTGSLDDEQIRIISEEIERLRALEERREAIIASIREQEKLSPELEAALRQAENLTRLEDLYAPYRPKRRTRAEIAKERGLGDLAALMMQNPWPKEAPEALAARYVGGEVTDVQAALAGARDVVAEQISDDAQLRSLVRGKAAGFARIVAAKNPKVDDPKAVYASYYEFSQRADRMLPHQILALNRGESEDVLRVSVEVEERDWRSALESVVPLRGNSAWIAQRVEAAEDAMKRLLLPAIERDLRRTMSETAEQHAIAVFASNLKALLGAPPLAERTVLGLDPGFRTGCKIAVVDPTGKVLATTAIFPHEPQKDRAGALKTLADLVKKYRVNLVSIGNGTASRESEDLVSELIGSVQGLQYLVVNEAGASIYSASTLARNELPGMDVTLRGAVSIARRAQDPLSELVKIDPKSIGVGMYQHDVDQKALGKSLDAVVESLVNAVGVDVNTASPALLTHVAGLGPKLASSIVAHRDEHGPFASRAALSKVAGLGPKTFEQAAGFLRVRGGKNPLDASAIHPESYEAARALLSQTGISMSDDAEKKRAKIQVLEKDPGIPKLAASLGCGEPTLKDILEQLVRPGRDPRDEAPAPLLRSGAMSLDDLTPGTVVKGTVRNVVDFGAFIDIGVKQDGLLHRSRIPQNRHLSVGDVLDLEVLDVDTGRGRISLGLAQRE